MAPKLLYGHNRRQHDPNVHYTMTSKCSTAGVFAWQLCNSGHDPILFPSNSQQLWDLTLDALCAKTKDDMKRLQAEAMRWRVGQRSETRAMKRKRGCGARNKELREGKMKSPPQGNTKGNRPWRPPCDGTPGTKREHRGNLVKATGTSQDLCRRPRCWEATMQCKEYLEDDTSPHS